jgi:hypothetical protein
MYFLQILFASHMRLHMHIGYYISQWLIMPYQEFEYSNERHARRQWNKAHSAMRIVVEHTFGRLKVRFPYLNGISGWDMDAMLHSIESLFVVYNILITLNDFPEHLDGPDLNEILREQAEQEARHPPRRRPDRAEPALRDGPEHIRLRGWERREQLRQTWENIFDRA